MSNTTVPGSVGAIMVSPNLWYLKGLISKLFLCTMILLLHILLSVSLEDSVSGGQFLFWGHKRCSRFGSSGLID